MAEKKHAIIFQNEIPKVYTKTITERLNIQTYKKEDLNEEEPKNDNENSGNNGRWAQNEHFRFLAGCLRYGNNWKKVETYVRTRTSTQIRSHAQKYLKKLEKKYIYHDLTDNQLNEISDKKNNHENSETVKDKEKDKISLEENEIDTDKGNKNEQINDLKNDEYITVDNSVKLSEEQINKLIEDLPTSDSNVEQVERIILKKFKLHKKLDDIPKPEIIKKNITKPIQTIKNNKTIFLCQKQKRQINYSNEIKNLLESNSQEDLYKLFKIYLDPKSNLYNNVMKEIEDNN